jgi:hypothetical protein
MKYEPPRILVDAISEGIWKHATPDSIRRCLGDDLYDMSVFEGVSEMEAMSGSLDEAIFLDDPIFCVAREENAQPDDPRLEFPRALFIGVSINVGDDTLIAIRQEKADEYDPFVLVFDWRQKVPYRWTKRGRLSELIRCLGFECQTKRNT